MSFSHSFVCVCVISNCSEESAYKYCQWVRDCTTQLRSQKLSDHNHFQNESKTMVPGFHSDLPIGPETCSNSLTNFTWFFSRRITLSMWFRTCILFYNLMSVDKPEIEIFLKPQPSTLMKDLFSLILSTLQWYFIKEWHDWCVWVGDKGPSLLEMES